MRPGCSRAAGLAYYDNYLIDTASRVILAVEATPARFRQETLAARRMLERVEQLGLRPESVGADKAYGSGEFWAWLLARGIQPHIPVIDRRHQTRGHFTREHFRYEARENIYYLPRRQAAALARSAAQQSRLRLLLDGSPVSRLSAEEAGCEGCGTWPSSSSWQLRPRTSNGWCSSSFSRSRGLPRALLEGGIKEEKENTNEGLGAHRTT